MKPYYVRRAQAREIARRYGVDSNGTFTDVLATLPKHYLPGKGPEVGGRALYKHEEVEAAFRPVQAGGK